MADNVFSTCLCITVYKVMSASNEDHLRASYLLRERAAFQPKMRLTADGGALSPIQPL